MDFNIELAQELLDSPEEFPVDMNRAWSWLGYSRKDKAVDTLKSYFEEGADFSTERGKSPTGGRPSDSYYLTTNCLKEFGMIARTEQGKLIRKYFLECEKIAKQVITQQTQAASPELPVIMPTEKELDYMRSRAWEKSEMMGFPISTEAVRRKTGYGRATDALRRFREQSEQRAVEGDRE